MLLFDSIVDSQLQGKVCHGPISLLRVDASTTTQTAQGRCFPLVQSYNKTKQEFSNWILHAFQYYPRHSARSYCSWLTPSSVNRFTYIYLYLPAVFSHITYFCLCAICALTWASTLVGSCTASFPSTLIKLEILTKKQKKTKKKNTVISSLARYVVIRRRPFFFQRLSWLMVSVWTESLLQFIHHTNFIERFQEVINPHVLLLKYPQLFEDTIQVEL